MVLRTIAVSFGTLNVMPIPSKLPDSSLSDSVYTAGVLWGFRDRDELVASGADVIVAHPDELLSCILDG